MANFRLLLIDDTTFIRLGLMDDGSLLRFLIGFCLLLFILRNDPACLLQLVVAALLDQVKCAEN